MVVASHVVSTFGEVHGWRSEGLCEQQACACCIDIRVHVAYFVPSRCHEQECHMAKSSKLGRQDQIIVSILSTNS